MKLTFSQKGIIALVIEGVSLPTSFQHKFDATPSSAKAISHQRIQTPFGVAQATILSFGKDLTWLYAYLTADAKTLKSARLRIQLPARVETLTDDSFPFAFSLPLQAGENGVKLSLEAVSAEGESMQSDKVDLRLD